MSSTDAIPLPFPKSARWQEKMKNIQESCRFLFNKELFSDVVFIAGKEQQKRIPAHKFVLICMSPVFSTLFNGSLPMHSNEIEVPDIEPGGLLAFLKYLYTEELAVNGDTVMSTLYAAKKYNVPSLENKCQSFLISCLNSDNACMLLTQARHFEQTQLCEQCLSVIDIDTNGAMAVDGFLEIDLDCLCTILERDSLNILEFELFQAVVIWAKARCKKLNLPDTPENHRAALDKAFNLIRFSEMTAAEFALGPATSGILKPDETIDVFLYLNASLDRSKKYQSRPRRTNAIMRFRKTYFPAPQLGDSFVFTVSKQVYLQAFHLYGCAFKEQSKTYHVHLTIKINSSYACQLQSKEYSCDGGRETFVVPLQSQVSLSPGYEYKVDVNVTGPQCFYGTQVVTSAKVFGDVEVNFLPSSRYFGMTNRTNGQVAGMVFSKQS